MPDISSFLADTPTLVAAVVLLATLLYCCLYYGLIHFRVGRWHRKARPAGADEHPAPTETQPQAEAPAEAPVAEEAAAGVNGEAPEAEAAQEAPLEAEPLPEASPAPEATADNALPPVSVVLTAHNDAEWLRENLVYLLEQDYPDFEVVVVDYLSRDDTQFVLKLLHDYYPHLKIVPFREDVNLFQGKKYPLSIGIKSAKNDILVLADPDCTPKNLMWLRGMVRGYRKRGTQIVLGFCGVKRGKTLLGALQVYDNLAYSSLYLGTALLGNPFTGSGRNLSYRRSFFFNRGAFIRHYDVADGSDDLFVYQNATRRNTAVCIDPDALLTAEPKPTFGAWHEERRHRVGTRNRHTLRGRVAEQLLPLGTVLFYASAAWLLATALPLWPVVAGVAALRWAWQIISFAQLCSRFDGGKLYLAAPLLEIYFIIANTILILLPLHSNRKY